MRGLRAISVKLVTGYIKWIDVQPPDISRFAWNGRLAFAQDSYHPSSADMLFDEDLYLAVLQALHHFVGARKCILMPESNSVIEVTEIAEIDALLLRLPEYERVPFQRILFEREGKILAACGSELYAEAGGPEPYRDTFCVPIYMSVEEISRFQPIVLDLCRRMGVKEIQEIDASQWRAPRPTIGSILRRLFRT